MKEMRNHLDQIIDGASLESFPASDAPSWNTERLDIKNSKLAKIRERVFFVVYSTKTNSQLYVYDSKEDLNKDWLSKFRKYCIEHGVDPSEFGVKIAVTPLEEDEAVYEPLEVRSFSKWQVVKIVNKNQLKNFLLDFFRL